MFRETLQKLIRKENLSEDDMSKIMTEIFSGNLTDAQIGAFIAALASKGETVEELVGAARVMRRNAHRIQVNAPIVVDIVGTGGDGANTFNISTIAAFVVAGCGLTVAKHGNRSVSSQCGSADLLEALGVNILCSPDLVEESVNQIGIGFLFAPLYHGAMRHAAKARKEIQIRSIFNMLGPLTNPAAANCQVLGVYAPELTEMFAAALNLLGAKRAMVVHGHDGLDEISVCAPTRISELQNGMVRTYDLLPDQYFGEMADSSALLGGAPALNAEISRSILQAETGPRRNCVVINAAAALITAGKAETFAEGIQLAAKAIDSGDALAKLNALIAFTGQQNG